MKSSLLLVTSSLLTAGCLGGEQAFIGARLPTLCSNAYSTCNVTAGCKLDADHYVRGRFPGTRRVILESELPRDTDYQVRLYLAEADAPGTELLAQLYEPDCSLDTQFARVHLEDVDLIDEAGLDRILILDDLTVTQQGEHLLEIFSDASVEYIMIVEPVSLSF